MLNLKKALQAICFSALATASLSAFAHHDEVVHLSADVGFVSTDHLPPGSSIVNPIRLQAIREAATTLGARGALAFRSLQIDHSLALQANFLDRVFDFNQLLLPHNVLPPVLVEANDSLNLANNQTIRLSSKIYQIVRSARFVTAPPNWRNYLWMTYSKPMLPHHSLLPTTEAEASVWNTYFQVGWQEGLKQADDIFAVNLARLKRDYMGMVLYRKLYAEHMVSAPYVAETNLGITGDSQELRINDRVIRITAPSALQTNSKKWTPVITK